MPTVQATDDFNHGDFTVPGGANYSNVLGTPVKDTTIVHGNDPASLRIQITAGNELVTNTITGGPTLGWHGFWWRIESDPSEDIDIAQMTPAVGVQAVLAYSSTNNFVYHYFPGGTTEDEAVEPVGSWVWIEMIFDTSANPNKVYTRFGGLDVSPAASVAQAASTVSSVNLGTNSGTSPDSRYSLHKWGSAASITDWLGPPDAYPTHVLMPPMVIG